MGREAGAIREKSLRKYWMTFIISSDVYQDNLGQCVIPTIPISPSTCYVTKITLDNV